MLSGLLLLNLNNVSNINHQMKVKCVKSMCFNTPANSLIPILFYSRCRITWINEPMRDYNTRTPATASPGDWTGDSNVATTTRLTGLSVWSSSDWSDWSRMDRVGSWSRGPPGRRDRRAPVSAAAAAAAASEIKSSQLSSSSSHQRDGNKQLFNGKKKRWWADRQTARREITNLKPAANNRQTDSGTG